MNTKSMRIALTLIFLLGLAVMASAQNAAQSGAKKAAPAQVPQVVTPKPVVYSTAPKLTVSKLKASETDVFDVRGKISYTVTAANTDDTIVGSMVYTIPDDARQKIAAITGKGLTSVPSSITRKDVVAKFQTATAPPIIHLEIAPMTIDVVGAIINFNRVSLDVPARDSSNAKFTSEEMETLFTIWARQISAGRSRRGIIAAMNRRIAGEDDQ